jgi:hypothetical protein
VSSEAGKRKEILLDKILKKGEKKETNNDRKRNKTEK